MWRSKVENGEIPSSGHPTPLADTYPKNSKILKRLIKYERERVKNPRLKKGWNPMLFDLDQDQGDSLVDSGILKLVPNDRGSRRYLLVNREGLLDTLMKGPPKPTVQQVDKVVNIKTKIGITLPDFGDIIGYDDIKELISETIRLKVKVHFLFLGSPGSAKTLFLLAIEQLPGSAYVMGSRMSRSGLSGFLIVERPKYLLVDELDKLSPRDLAPLLGLCESGRIIETLNRKRYEAQMDTIVFGATNSIKRLPPELISRFQVLEFPEYSREDFVKVCEHILVRREKLTILEARQIAVRVMDDLNSMDVRMAIRVARLARSKLGIDGVIEIFRHYTPENTP